MEKKTTVLITGASGLIGTALTRKLLNAGYRVKHLGRKRKEIPEVSSYVWNIEKATIESEAFDGVEYIVHLAGANVGEGRWTAQRKDEILTSRVGSTLLLNNWLEENQHTVKKIIAASAIGFYGTKQRISPYTEEDLPGKDFMAQVCVAWETSVMKGPKNIQKLIYRLGVVLSSEGGAYPKLVQPIKLLAASPIGSGKQFLSWVHIEDVCWAMIWGIEQPTMEGIFNLTAPNPVTNAALMQALAKAYQKPYIPFGPPPFALKMLLGEQADMVLEGVAVNSEKLLKHGFEFRYSRIEDALENLKQKI